MSLPRRTKSPVFKHQPHYPSATQPHPYTTIPLRIYLPPILTDEYNSCNPGSLEGAIATLPTTRSRGRHVLIGFADNDPQGSVSLFPAIWFKSDVLSSDLRQRPNSLGTRLMASTTKYATSASPSEVCRTRFPSAPLLSKRRETPFSPFTRYRWNSLSTSSLSR